MTTIIVRELF